MALILSERHSLATLTRLTCSNTIGTKKSHFPDLFSVES